MTEVSKADSNYYQEYTQIKIRSFTHSCCEDKFIQSL